MEPVTLTDLEQEFYIVHDNLKTGTVTKDDSYRIQKSSSKHLVVSFFTTLHYMVHSFNFLYNLIYSKLYAIAFRIKLIWADSFLRLKHPFKVLLFFRILFSNNIFNFCFIVYVHISTY